MGFNGGFFGNAGAPTQQAAPVHIMAVIETRSRFKPVTLPTDQTQLVQVSTKFGKGRLWSGNVEWLRLPRADGKPLASVHFRFDQKQKALTKDGATPSTDRLIELAEWPCTTVCSWSATRL